MAIELDSRHLLLPKTEWENEDLTLISREIKGNCCRSKCYTFVVYKVYMR
jgi:hypothetical protein